MEQFKVTQTKVKLDLHQTYVSGPAHRYRQYIDKFLNTCFDIDHLLGHWMLKLIWLILHKLLQVWDHIWWPLQSKYKRQVSRKNFLFHCWLSGH